MSHYCRPYAYLHLATEHPVALYATYLTLLDGEGLPAGVEYGTYGRYDDSLARLYVGGRHRRSVGVRPDRCLRW